MLVVVVMMMVVDVAAVTALFFFLPMKSRKKIFGYFYGSSIFPVLFVYI